MKFDDANLSTTEWRQLTKEEKQSWNEQAKQLDKPQQDVSTKQQQLKMKPVVAAKEQKLPKNRILEANHQANH